LQQLKSGVALKKGKCLETLVDPWDSNLGPRDYEAGSNILGIIGTSQLWRFPFLKWSNPAGHLAKVVILPTEVKDDDREKAAEIHA